MRKIAISFFVYLYIFVFLGFILHTSINKQQIFDKYSVGYFIILILLLLAFIPYAFFIRFMGNTSDYQLGKKKFSVTSGRKVLYLVVCFFVFICIIEFFMRARGIDVNKGYYNINNFQPYLQSRLIPDPVENVDSYGFRDDEITKVKPKGTYRIIVLGGSTAYENHVPFEQTAPKLLQDMLRKQYNNSRIEVINAGVSGYNSEHSLIDYETRISDFNPDLVIMWHGVNDLYESCYDDSRNFSRPYSSDYSHNFGALKNMVYAYYDRPPISISIHLFSFDYAWSVLGKYIYTDLDDIPNKIVEIWASHIPTVNMQFQSITAYKRNVHYLISAVKADHAQIILGNQPNMFNTMSRYGMQPNPLNSSNGKVRASFNSQIKAMGQFNNATKEVARENNVPFVDLDAALPRTPDNFYDGLHWTSHGAKLAAEALDKVVISSGFIGK